MDNNKKPFYLSKTLWVNVIAWGAGLIFGKEFIVNNPGIAVTIFAGLNGILRLVTKKEISFFE